MSEHEDESSPFALPGYRLLRTKREWVPEWLWRAFCRNPNPEKRLALRDPWRALLTRDARDPNEALRWWGEEGETHER